MKLKGANAERTAILAKIRRMKYSAGTDASFMKEHLIRWMLERNERYNKRAGGLGK
jgi:hypothetical protein